MMRRNKLSQEELFDFFSVEERVPQDHPQGRKVSGLEAVDSIEVIRSPQF